MILVWMISATLFGAFVALAAAAAQPFVRALRRPSRWTWVVALVVAALWPVVSTAALLLMPSLRDATVRLSSIRVLPDGAALGLGGSESAVAMISRGAIALWLLASVLLLIRLVRTLVGLRQMRAALERRVVDGVEVLVGGDIGPATIGLRRHDVVLPRSVLALEEPLRRLVLRHECEHRAARDPWLLVAGSVALVMFPWNAALWVIAQRLRLAVELDCDARVLARGEDPSRYGRLLLLFAQRGRELPLALTLGASPSQLERRIIAMRTSLARPRPLQLLAAAALGAIGIAGACSAGAPDAPSIVRTSASARRTESPTAATEKFFEFQVDEQAHQLRGTGILRYPREMRLANREGEVLTQFVVDEHGIVDMATFKALASTDPAFTAAVRAALPTMRFSPARMKGRAVKQVVQQPFTFTLSGS